MRLGKIQITLSENDCNQLDSCSKFYIMLSIIMIIQSVNADGKYRTSSVPDSERTSGCAMCSNMK